MITDSQIFLFFLSIRSPIRQHHLSGWQSPKELWVPITQLLGVTNYLLRDLPVIRSCTKSSLVSRFPNNFCRLSQNGRSVLVFQLQERRVAYLSLSLIFLQNPRFYPHLALPSSRTSCLLKVFTKETFMRLFIPCASISRLLKNSDWKSKRDTKLENWFKLFLGAYLPLQFKLFLILPHWPLITFISLLKSNAFLWNEDISLNQKKKSRVRGQRWLSGWKHVLFLKRTWVLFPKTSVEQLATA